MAASQIGQVMASDPHPGKGRPPTTDLTRAIGVVDETGQLWGQLDAVNTVDPLDLSHRAGVQVEHAV